MPTFDLLDLLDHPLTKTILGVAGAIAATLLILRVVRHLLQGRIKDNAARYRAVKATSVVGYIAVVLIIVTQMAGQLSGFTVAIGAASAGIAFALQEVIASYAGWLAVALGGFFNVGDRVQLGGIRGDVIDIGFLRTTIMECGDWVKGDLYNGRIVRVANSFVFKEPVFNYSGDFPFLWDEITVPIKYGSDYTLARAVLTDIAVDVVGKNAADARARWALLVQSYRVEDARLDPLVTLVATDNWVEFTIRYVVLPRERRTTKDVLFTRILAAVDDSGGRLAWASTTLQLVDLPPVRVSLDGGADNTSD